MKNKTQIRLRHLDMISKPNLNAVEIFKDVLKYNRWKFWKIFAFIKQIRQLSLQIETCRNTDFSKVEETKLPNIKRPSSIDDIPLIAMLELHGLFNEDVSDISTGTLIIQIISISCFKINNPDKDLIINNKDFLEFKNKVADSDLILSMGLYKWINRSIEESSRAWEKAFFDVEVIDEEYIKSGGAMLNKFNSLTTIQNTAKDFNESFEQAQQRSYGITQANSLKAATIARVQKNMSDLAEARMKSQRAQ